MLSHHSTQGYHNLPHEHPRFTTGLSIPPRHIELVFEQAIPKLLELSQSKSDTPPPASAQSNSASSHPTH
jgi:hypothetical protein